MLDIENAIRQPLAVQHHQLGQNAIDHPIADAGQAGTRVGRSVGARRRRAPTRQWTNLRIIRVGIQRRRAPTFQKRIHRRIEQPPAPRRQPQIAMPRPAVNQPKQRQQLRPRPIPRIHRIGIAPGVGLQPLEQPAHRVMVDVQRIGGDQPAIFGVQDKNQPQQHRQQAAVDRIRVAAGQLAQQRPVGLGIGGLKPAQQFVQRRQHLGGQLGRDRILIAAALGQNRRQAPLRRQVEQPVGPQQQMQRREHQAAVGGDQFGDAKDQRPGTLARRRINQPQLRAVGQQADGNLLLAQQPFEAGLRAGWPAGGLQRLVQRRPHRTDLHQQQPLVRVLPHRMRQAQHVVVIGQRHPQLRRRRLQVVRLPAEPIHEQPRPVGDRRDRGTVRQGNIAHPGQKRPMLRRDVEVENGLRRQQCRWRNHQTNRLDKTQPAAMIVQGGVGHGFSPCNAIFNLEPMKTLGEIRLWFTIPINIIADPFA